MKAGKEEIMGLLAVVEQWVVGTIIRPSEAAWEERLQKIVDAVGQYTTVQTSIRPPGRLNVAPVLSVEWDPEALGISGGEVDESCLSGTPRIEVFNGTRFFRHAVYDIAMPRSWLTA